MTKHRTIAGFVAVGLLAAVTTAATMRSYHPIGTWLSQSAQPEIGKPITLGEPSLDGTKKPVRYETIIDNWKRYRSATSRPNT